MFNGFYEECLAIPKNIFLIGENNQQTIVSSDQSKFYTIYMLNSFIENFKIVNGENGIYFGESNSIILNNTVINLYMNEPSEIEFYICDINGKRVKNILNGPLTTGNHRIEWDGISETGKKVASGAYFCVLKGDGFFKKIKLLLIK